MALRTYIWNVAWGWGSMPNSPPIKRYYQNFDFKYKLGDFDKKNGENGISVMPRSILRFSIWNWTIQTFSHTLIYVAWCSSRTFWGLYWSVGNSLTVRACRCQVPFQVHLHLTCYLFQYTCRWPLLSKKSRTLLDTHTLQHGMPGWAVQRQDYAELRVHVSTSILYPSTTLPC